MSTFVKNVMPSPQQMPPPPGPGKELHDGAAMRRVLGHC